MVNQLLKIESQTSLWHKILICANTWNWQTDTMKMRQSNASLHLFCCCLLIHCPAQNIRTSLPFAIYYQQPSNHQTLNPAQNPPSSTYTFMQAPHISAFHVIQTRESIPPETAVVVQNEIIPESTPNKENQITMLSGERWTARKPEERICD